MPLLEKKDILFIVNPNSGKRNAGKIVEQISKFDHGIAFVITQSAAELKTVFNKNIEKYTVFVVAGGDGSISEAARYLANRNDKILAVYPTGSGNGFAREMGFGKSMKVLFRNIYRGESVQVDLLKINNQVCINVAGLGLDSFIAHHFQQSKTRGLKNYIKSTVYSLFRFNGFDAEIITGSKKINGNFLMISIANTRQFGNNAIISPQSNPCDGVFEVVLVKQFPFFLYPVFVIKMFRGSLKESKYISFLKTSEPVEIITGFKKLHIDGDPKTFEKNLNVSMAKEKIRVLKTG